VVEVETSRGERRRAEVEYFKGHVANPLSNEELEQKFREQAEARMARHVLQPLMEKLWALESVSDIKELIDLLVARRLD
jgi:2-methylcitrate dehydratase PrpD